MTNERFHSLDTVRACALLAGILLHAIMAFLPGFRDVNWPLSDTSTSTSLGILFFVIHLFRMSLFFIMAGFFARMLHQHLGTKGFIKNRLKRIGLPLIAAFFVVMPFTIVAIIWGARQLGIQGPPKMESPIPVIGPPLPWGHLWFLYMLLVIYALSLSMRTLIKQFDTSGTGCTAIENLFVTAIKSRVAILLLATPLALSLYASPWWVQWQGIPAPIIGLVPNLPALIAYGSAFLVGWLLHRKQEALQVLAADWFLYFVGAVIASVVALYIVGITPKFTVMSLGDSDRAIYAITYVIGLWCGAFATIGFAVRYFKTPNARWRYLADASYWMYLIHLPIVWLLQAWMLSWPLYWPLKLLLILAMTSVVLLTTYHYFVRTTFIGKFLNGRKYPRSSVAETAKL
jgi:glucan biosynthesis protein C